MFSHWFLQEQREEVSSMSALLSVVERASESNILLAERTTCRGTRSATRARLQAPHPLPAALCSRSLPPSFRRSRCRLSAALTVSANFD